MGGLTRRRLIAGAGATAAAAAVPRAAIAAATAAGQPSRGRWLAGDFHSHTVLSHDVWSGPDDDNTSAQDAYTLGWTAGQQIFHAETRGLDFLALTDHNRTDALRLAEYRSDKLTLLPGYEHTLSGGHSGVFMPSVADLADIIRDSDGSTGFWGSDPASRDAAVQRYLDLVHAKGGIAILNHPFYGNANDGDAIYWKYGNDVSAGFDAIEVWNIGWPARHDTLPFADSDNYLSLPWWEQQILARARRPAVGGSDNHWRSTTAIQGVGQPTTWVYAGGRSTSAILDAVRAGRTFVAAEPPALGGARLLLTAREAWKGGQRAMVGGEVASGGPIVVKVRATGSEGNTLRVICGSGVPGEPAAVVAEKRVSGPDETHSFRLVLPEGGWTRAEVFVDDGYWMTALTSPIYGGAPVGTATATTGAAATYGDPTRTNTQKPLALRLRRGAGCGC
ncbi:MAG: CehA/McbA family metallohydrolase [Thermoleophilaceae bacterium]